MLPTPCQSTPAGHVICGRLQIGDGDLHVALDALHEIGEASRSAAAFAQHGVETLARLVNSELTTLSDCDLQSGRRRVLSDAPGAISPREHAIFDHYLLQHPLVNAHRDSARAVTTRISDVLPSAEFQRSALFNDYYRCIGLEHVMAAPIHVSGKRLVGFVFNRSTRDFSWRDRACLEAIRPHLGDLYRLCCGGPFAPQRPPEPALPAGDFVLPLTAREREVLQWLAAGKTDKDIGSILGISPRTVHKHLQRIYEELGVETRTAAVMRALTFQPQCWVPNQLSPCTASRKTSVAGVAAIAPA